MTVKIKEREISDEDAAETLEILQRNVEDSRKNDIITHALCYFIEMHSGSQISLSRLTEHTVDTLEIGRVETATGLEKKEIEKEEEDVDES